LQVPGPIRDGLPIWKARSSAVSVVPRLFPATGLADGPLTRCSKCRDDEDRAGHGPRDIDFRRSQLHPNSLSACGYLTGYSQRVVRRVYYMEHGYKARLASKQHFYSPISPFLFNSDP